MSTFYSFSPNNTSINFSWPAEVTGLERIMLSAQGDLQRVMSAFFARSISIATIYSHTHTQTSPSSPLIPLSLPNAAALSSTSLDAPIIQTRQVLLQCAGKTVCTATSTVRITSPRCAQLFLEEKYAIGQMFRKLEKLPHFELVAVGFGGNSVKDGADCDEGLWRKYKLIVPEFECEILEEFPSREMFTRGEDWLVGNLYPVDKRVVWPTFSTALDAAESGSVGFGGQAYSRHALTV